MSYIRTKIINGNSYLYEQESYRDNKGHVHTKHVRYIGKAGMSHGKGSLGTTASKSGNKNLGTTRKIEHVHPNEFHSIHSSHNDVSPFDKKYVGMELNRHMIVTIPSTQGQKHVSQKIIDSRARDMASKMTEEFGGSTRIKGQGQYYNKRYKKVDDENIVKVEVFMTKKQWDSNKTKVEKYLVSKQKAWKQEDLAVEYDKSDTMYFIHEK